ncbi:MAG: DoxX family membrane protein [Candidatus Eremiobacteraeota bacterium]|nr:DoxX family membrane protein [Candidatus Eremiobacteraeota bacterium]
MNLAIALARFVVGALLMLAGALKIGHAAQLASAVAGFRLLPAPAVSFVGIVLPYFEILLGLYLVIGLFTRISAIVAALAFALYAGAIASAIVRGIPADCGCFGPNDVAVADWPHVAFDLVLAVIAAFIAYGAPGRFAVDRRLVS